MAARRWLIIGCLFCLSAGCKNGASEDEDAVDSGSDSGGGAGGDSDAGGDADSDADTDAGADAGACAANSYRQCGADGEVHWFDSCGVEGVAADECGTGESCVETTGIMARCVRGSWARIAAGSFWMGSPDGDCPAGYPGGSGAACGSELGRSATAFHEELHPVTLTRAFEMMTTEVTQGDFSTVLGWNPSAFDTCGRTCPVESVSWYDALAYANGLSESAGLAPCYLLSDVICQDATDAGTDYLDCMNGTRGGIDSATVALGSGAGTPYDCAGFRLPTEAEWEYAVRAGSFSAFYPSEGNDGTITNTNSDPNMDQIGWYDYNADTGSGVEMHPVGGKEPNAWGLYDMLGNVEEWVWDWYAVFSADPATDPAGPASASLRVERGGYNSDYAEDCRSAYRLSYGPDARNMSGGFRLARSAP